MRLDGGGGRRSTHLPRAARDPRPIHRLSTASPPRFTDFGGGRLRDDRELNRAIAAQAALGRVGLPDDIGGAVAMLLAPESNWITGQRIEFSGGMML